MGVFLFFFKYNKGSVVFKEYKADSGETRRLLFKKEKHNIKSFFTCSFYSFHKTFLKVARKGLNVHRFHLCEVMTSA